MSTAEAIAELVADLRAGRVKLPTRVTQRVQDMFLPQAQEPQPVVDCTAIFAAQSNMTSIQLYEDNPTITPPWEDALFGYVNTYGNTIIMQVHREDWDGTALSKEAWATQNNVDWPTIRWIATTTVWAGGTGGDGRPMDTWGPCHIIRHAIDATGAPQDINWIAIMAKPGQIADINNLDDPGLQTWQAVTVTITAALNFLNCTNVDIAEPARPRPERRRLARTGVTVQTIVVRPPGRRRDTSTHARPIDDTETTLSPVRGHFARYGPQYGKGLLFGKYPGKFWISGHVRGAGADTDDEP